MDINDQIIEDAFDERNTKDETLELMNLYTLNKFKQQIKETRNSMNMNQKNLANGINAKQPTISRVESMDNNRILVSTLQDIAAQLDCVLVMNLVPRSEIRTKLKNKQSKT